MSAKPKLVEKDGEMFVEKHRFYIGEDNILHIDVVGEQDEQTALAMKEAVERLAGGADHKHNVLVDNSKAGKATSEARRIFQDLMDAKNFGKIAIFGTHPVARVMASFVIGVARKRDVRFFGSKEEALAWLKK